MNKLIRAITLALLFLSLSVPWTVQTTIPAEDPPELLFVDVPVGEMFYRAVVIDLVGARGNDVVISATGEFDLPGTVTNFTATDE